MENLYHNVCMYVCMILKTECTGTKNAHEMIVFNRFDDRNYASTNK